MLKTYTNPEYDYIPSSDLTANNPVHHPVIIIGAGPCGLAAALDLAVQGIKSVVLDDNNTVSVGSRAICFSKRTLEILDRYGCAAPMIEKGVTWKKGKVFFKEKQIYDFDLLAEDGHKLPAFINLQQYYFEEYMVDRAMEFSEIDLRWKSKVTSVETNADVTMIEVETPDGSYTLTCDYLLVADGANSSIRTMLGLESKGQEFHDRFLIADVVMKADFPTERWFWFDPPFHPNQSVLLHKQADNVWRIDFQLGWDADPEEEKKEENIRPRIQQMLGEDVEFELEWASVYTFKCRRMDNFIQDRVIFMGDAAHQVSPFGARGANGGIQAVENLAWKLARVLKDEAPASLLETYNTERVHGAAENILNSTRATDFITPKNDISRTFRDETLRLAEKYPFARSLVNSGRLSLPCDYLTSDLIIHAETDGAAPGFVAPDAPVKVDGNDTWLMDILGNRFVALINPEGMTDAQIDAYKNLSSDMDVLEVRGSATGDNIINDEKGFMTDRYDLKPGAVYLIRPDQYIAAYFVNPEVSELEGALKHSLGIQ
ncbi:FAD-dependent oxidoreductase [Sneathiella sp. P13V-1]|uniref:FAD-dependent oxidoreductase n=1 Tax=Sneathiella sp. P13V-1 TaxID=2697366 RepID=UPI00187B11B4|nr:FAD-dependent oxidoreductase [Sneathiella sp. P13V-1]MBE7637825.1 FAD-dependent oxidoreductase [Sneathiella sp. P13V-1]